MQMESGDEAMGGAIAETEPPVGRVVHLDYTPHGQTGHVIPIDLASVTSAHGAAILGCEFPVSHPDTDLRVRVALNAWVEAENVLVVALFRNGEGSPVGLHVTPLRAGERGFVDVTFLVPAVNAGVVGFEVRVGPGRPGTIHINGDAFGERPIRPVPFLQVEEDMQRGSGVRPDATIAPLSPDALALLRGELWRLNEAYDNTQSVIAHLALHALGDAVRLMEGKARRKSLPEPTPLRHDGLVAALRKVEVPARKAFRKNVPVILVFGQSNAANEGLGPAETSADVFNWNYIDGKCYKAGDPMLGATGSGGSLMVRLGEKLVREGVFPAVVFVPLAVGGTFVHDWTPQGRYFPRLLGALRRLRKMRHPPTHILWHQGEADASFGTAPDAYMARFQAIVAAIRAEGCSAPIYIANATRCGSIVSSDIRTAQRRLADGRTILAGPDTDAISHSDDRAADGVHMSASGLDKHAELWFQILKQS